ncbi:MAG: calcium/sodium antiporter [Patescibacteria group bacterium]|jgi:cation:H+ antiporter
MLSYILFAVGFVILIKGADYLVEGSSSIAKRWGLSSIFIGLTVVAFGTSAPEFFVNIIASIEGRSGIVAGTILGSNIVNILLILGIAALITPLTVNTATVSRQIPLSLLAVIVLAVLVNDKFITHEPFNALSRGDGLILITFFVIFLYSVASVMHQKGQEMPIKEHKRSKSLLMILGGCVLLALGGKWIVDGAVQIAQVLEIRESVVGLTIIAVGTSLPELAASGVAAYKGKTDIAVGNVIGSNIFRIFWVLGVSALIRPVNFSDNLNFDILAVGAATVLLLAALYTNKKRILERWEGYVFIILYILYIGFLIYRS